MTGSEEQIVLAGKLQHNLLQEINYLLNRMSTCVAVDRPHQVRVFKFVQREAARRWQALIEANVDATYWLDAYQPLPMHEYAKAFLRPIIAQARLKWLSKAPHAGGTPRQRQTQG